MTLINCDILSVCPSPVVDGNCTSLKFSVISECVCILQALEMHFVAFLFGYLQIDWFPFIQGAFCFSGVQALLIGVRNGRLCGEGEPSERIFILFVLCLCYHANVGLGCVSVFF